MAHEYENLSYDLILTAIERLGLDPSGRILALNSYENRVFQIELNEKENIIAKFYRPGRWSDEAILEEHKFSLSLDKNEIPVVAPFEFKNNTMFFYEGFRFALFPSRGGRVPNLENMNNLQWIGRLIGRIHLMGENNPYEFRHKLDSKSFGWSAREAVLKGNLLPDECRQEYEEISEQLIKSTETIFKEIKPKYIKLHGDCHPGNILWTGMGPHFIDMDDGCNGPAVQDLWMLLNGNKDEIKKQILSLIDGYESFFVFNKAELNLIEALRSLRQLHYSGWITKRWGDPAFPLAFPWYTERSFWQGYISDLKIQQSSLDRQISGCIDLF